MKILLLSAVMGLAQLLTGCAALPDDVGLEMAPAGTHERDPFKSSVGRAPFEAMHPVTGLSQPPAASTLSSGMLLVWSNPGAAGLFVSLFAERFSPWTHIGVVSVEKDGVFVYDANANLEVHVNGPASASGGGVQRIPYQSYVDSERIYGLFAPPSELDVPALLRYVKEHHRRQTRFDARYDSTDDGALYCSELLALGFASAGMAPIRPEPVRENRSYQRLRAWLGISSQGFYLPGQLVDERRRLAVWGRSRNPAQIEALFSARRELSRRFDAQARLGQLMKWNPMAMSLVTALDLRDAPRHFVDAVEAAYAQRPEAAARADAIEREVAARAVWYFGQAAGP